MTYKRGRNDYDTDERTRAVDSHLLYARVGDLVYDSVYLVAGVVLRTEYTHVVLFLMDDGCPFNVPIEYVRRLA